jgi:hypothetical protein
MIRGLTAHKDEIKNINETGTAVITRKVAEGVTPSVDSCPLGDVGNIIWWREALSMKKSQAKIYSKIDTIEVGELKGVPAWVVTVSKVDKPQA